MAPGDSPAGAGIVDGVTLYPLDQRAAELSDLTVTDRDEQVADAQEDGSLWSAQCVLVAGLLVMVVGGPSRTRPGTRIYCGRLFPPYSGQPSME
ncbi:hypothetical protein AB0I77_22900 [Streptomyces sp. NPDC050619]|uniref:hypothetical protein n=1 Tax=Streptomyces sp. NPDC050619 TaxID=3157214 RepID=UPI0034316165